MLLVTGASAFRQCSKTSETVNDPENKQKRNTRFHRSNQLSLFFEWRSVLLMLFFSLLFSWKTFSQQSVMA
jgi:hypothetical protein